MENPNSPIQIPKLHINTAGELEVGTELGAVKFTKPVAYQEIDGKRVEVACAYTIVECVDNLEFGLGNLDFPPVPHSTNSDSPNPHSAFHTPHSAINNSQPTYSFKVASYDTTKDLIIDPLLASTFLGGGSGEYINAIAIDKSGNIYVTGATWGGFPVTSGAYDIDYNGGHEDVFVSKFSSDLTQLLASTYLGGAADDVIRAMALDSEGGVYVTGQTISYNFPVTDGAYDTSFSYNRDGFVSRLDKDLTMLLASTYLGGNHNITSSNGLALDADGNIYVTGFTKGSEASDFPVTADAYDTSYNGPINNMDADGGDVFVSKLNSALTAMLASTYLGGSAYEKGISVTLDKSGNVYVAGSTTSSDFPVTDDAYDTSYNGEYFAYGLEGDVFVSKLSGDLKYLFASTYLGGA